VRPSMGSVGDCFDNAMCESFFATLECELLDRCHFKLRSKRARRSLNSSRAGITLVAAIRPSAIYLPLTTRTAIVKTLGTAALPSTEPGNSTQGYGHRARRS
jgi:transposase InsO family protein